MTVLSNFVPFNLKPLLIAYCQHFCVAETLIFKYHHLTNLKNNVNAAPFFYKLKDLRKKKGAENIAQYLCRVLWLFKWLGRWQ